MIRQKELEALRGGLQDAIKMLKETPLFEQCQDSYLKALKKAEELDVQLMKDHETLRTIMESLPPGNYVQFDELMQQYNQGCNDVEVEGSMSAIFEELRSRRPEAVECEEAKGQGNGDGDDVEEEMRVLEVVRSHRDPLGGGLIKDPVKSKHCGHVYDRNTLLEYIESSKRLKKMFYQCPYSLCTNKRNMDMKDMIDCPEFLAS